MLNPDAIFSLAARVDPERACVCQKELGSEPESALGVLLGTVFPPLCPAFDWQLEAVRGFTRTGINKHRSKRAVLAAFTRHASPGTASFAAALHRQAWIEKARIALRELLPRDVGGPDVDETARELSHLADAVLEMALRDAELSAVERFGLPRCADGSPSKMVIFGMGKLGGQELNAGSDIDIVFAYDTDEGRSQVSLHEHWTFVARRVVQSIDNPADEGSIFRVDLRLRPEGGKGPLVNSVAAIDRYYETWGRLWERAAWLRGRAVAGDPELGALLQREVFGPFVYRHAVDPALAGSLAELIERARVEQGPGAADDLKIGLGGIREAEFFVQALQLIWGGREPSLRTANTLRALERLSSRGFVKGREASEIEQGYLVLRRIEHRVQWTSGIQTHRLPEDAAGLERLSRSLWYGSVARFREDLRKTRSRISKLFRSLLPHAEYPSSPYTELLLALDRPAPGPSEASLSDRDAELLEHLRALSRRPDNLLGELTRERYPGLVDALLEAIQSCSNPIQAAAYLRSFFGKVLSASAIIGPLATDPAALARFANILGASAFVGDALLARPDLADIILFGLGQLASVSPAEIVDQQIRAFEREMAANPGASRDERRDEFMAALRRAKGKVTVDVAAADLAGLVEPRDVTRLLSKLADEILERAVRFELGPDVRGLSVIAVGKLGGQDIGYGSDLDVLFVYDPSAAPEGTFAPDYFTRVAQRVIHVISDAHWAGAGYELDIRLRPSGSKGLLVTSLESFARYHRVALPGSPLDSGEPQVLTSGAAWERQALLRARYAAGDRALGETLIGVAHEAAYTRGAPNVLEMHRLRLRMESELGRERLGIYDPKTGKGGLLDVEFACQWLQMHHGHDPRVRTTDTLEALAALYQSGYLGEEPFVALRDGYTFLRALEQRIRIGKGGGRAAINADPEELEPLARRMGIRTMPNVSAAELLIQRYLEVTGEVRATYLRVLGLSDEEAGIATARGQR